MNAALTKVRNNKNGWGRGKPLYDLRCSGQPCANIAISNSNGSTSMINCYVKMVNTHFPVYLSDDCHLSVIVVVDD